MKTMRLRDRMTLWFSLMTFFTASIFSAAVYIITGQMLDKLLRQEVELTLSQVAVQVENEDGHLYFADEVPVSKGAVYFITEEDGSELFSRGADIALFDDISLEPGAIRKVEKEGARWLLLDSQLLNKDGFSIRVRVAISCANNETVLAALLRVIFIALPVLLIISVAGGRFIAARSLRPIREIISSAEAIAEGDLSARVPPAPARDELGEMTDTLNHMLESVEEAFIREKRFASDASHELRTPAAVLRAYAETLLQEEALTAAQKTALQTMVLECGKMQKLIRQLLTIARGQEGRYPVTMEEVALWPLCAGIQEVMADSLEEKGIKMELDVPEALTVQADQSLLAELVLNLAENAVKYGKENGHIQIQAAKEDKGVRLSVSDDGIGIPEDAVPHIFERFYRVDAARDRGGTGLGLSICEWIARAHGGSIRATSEQGKGTRMDVFLPFRS